MEVPQGNIYSHLEARGLRNVGKKIILVTFLLSPMMYKVIHIVLQFETVQNNP